ncbi:MAG: hypothetical protein EA376_12185 [Phycisphaeraceae bacterium]|nr:MAG: hypothetical protein EA376_12185 [Phycisphaeraceae bacterium]
MNDHAPTTRSVIFRPAALCIALAAAALTASCNEEAPNARADLESRQGSISRQLDRIAEEMEEEARRQRHSWVVELIEAGPNDPATLTVLKARAGLTEEQAQEALASLPADVARELTEDEADALRRSLSQTGATVRAYSTYTPPEDDL